MNFPHGVKGNDVESNVIGPRDVNSLILRSWRVVAIFPLLYFAVCLLLFCERVLAQSVMVQPTKIEISAKPGQRLVGEIRITNTSTSDPQATMIDLHELTQNLKGIFIADAAGPADNVDPTLSRSLRSWLSVDVKELEIPPLETSAYTYAIEIPRNATGFYAAAMAVRTIPGDDPAGNIKVVIRFVIPVLLTIQGRPLRQNIKADGADMSFVTETDDGPSHTVAYVLAKNAGQTYSEVSGRLTVAKNIGGSWRNIVRQELDAIRIMPGYTVRLENNLGRNLPSGNYRVTANLNADGRRIPAFIHELEYIGDPALSSVTDYLQLSIEPSIIVVEGAPNARRIAILTIRNDGDDPVDVVCSWGQPAALKGVAMGDVLGDHFSAHEWLSVNPPRFRLAGGRERKIQVKTIYPADLSKPNYYATLEIGAKYLDAQRGATLETLVIASNRKQSGVPRLQPLGPLQLAQVSDTEYAVAVKFGNTGDVHLRPDASGRVLSVGILSTVVQFKMERRDGIDLPLGTPRYNGTIDFARIDPGNYFLSVVARYEGLTSEQTLPIRVSDGEDGKIVEVIDLEEAEETASEETGGTTSEKTGGTTSESSEDAEAEAAVN